MVDSSSPPTARLTAAANNPTCADTPGWTTTDPLSGRTAACSTFLVSCSKAEVEENCCKCKKECCGKCDDWDIFTCGPRTAPPALAPAPSPTRPPSDDTVCGCTRTRFIHGQSINEQYTKTCSKEIVRNWPEDCGACCSHISGAYGWLALLLFLLSPIVYWACYRNRGEGTEAEEEADVTPTATAYPAEEEADVTPTATAYAAEGGVTPTAPAYPAEETVPEPANAHRPPNGIDADGRADQEARVPLLADVNAEQERFASLLAK